MVIIAAHVMAGWEAYILHSKIKSVPNFGLTKCSLLLSYSPPSGDNYNKWNDKYRKPINQVGSNHCSIITIIVSSRLGFWDADRHHHPSTQQWHWPLRYIELHLKMFRETSVKPDDGGHDVIAIFNLPCKSMQIRFTLQILKLTCKTSVK